MDENEKYAKEIGLDKQPIAHHKNKRLSNIFVNIVLGVILLSVVMFSWLVFFPHKVITIKSTTVLTPTIQAGQTLKIRFNYCAYISQEGIVYRVLKNGDNSYNLPSTTTITEPGCREATLLIQTNPDTPPGTYILHDYAIYQINPFRSERASFDTSQIVITK